MASGVRIFSRVRIVSLTGMAWVWVMTIIDEENRDSSRGHYGQVNSPVGPNLTLHCML